MSDTERNALVIAITGGIACGKSEVGRIVGTMGFLLCDADRVAHGKMVRGTPVYRKIVQYFGDEILDDEGEISRPALGKIVFANPQERMALNRMVHPVVREALETWIAQRRQNGENAAVQIPLLFESGMEVLDWDAIICVSSRRDDIFERLQKRGMTLLEASSRVESQMPVEEKERRSDYVIKNLGTLQELERVTRETVNSLLLER